MTPKRLLSIYSAAFFFIYLALSKIEIHLLNGRQRLQNIIFTNGA